jgi:nucleoid-associated protein YgaU
MTRETKIGLLVGLAFIIVIGILLSDHLTSSTEPPPAPLTATGNNTRRSMQVPGANPQANAPIVVPHNVPTQYTVPTPRDLQPPTPPSAIVKVSVGSANNDAQNQATPNDQAHSPEQQPNTPVDPSTSAIARVAEQHDEQLVNANPNSAQQTHNATTPTPAMGFKDYTAEAGDTVSKMAFKFFGNKNKASQDAIIHANPTLQQDPNRVMEGKHYRIPISPDPVPTAGLAAVTPARSNVTTSATEYSYTVKEGDSLWRIASEQLGNPGAVDAIKELNKDEIGDGSRIQVGVKLRLPGKPLARAN